MAPAELAELLERHAYECYLTEQHDDAAASRRRALYLFARPAEPDRIRTLLDRSPPAKLTTQRR